MLPCPTKEHFLPPARALGVSVLYGIISAVGAQGSELAQMSCHDKNEGIPACGTCLHAREPDEYLTWKKGMIAQTREMMRFWGFQNNRDDSIYDDRLDHYMYKTMELPLTDTERQELERMVDYEPMLAYMAACASKEAYELVRHRYIELRVHELLERKDSKEQRDATFSRWCNNKRKDCSSELPWWHEAKSVDSAAARYAVKYMEGVDDPQLREAALHELDKEIKEVQDNQRDVDHIFRSLVFIAWLLSDDELKEWKEKVLHACCPEGI